MKTYNSTSSNHSLGFTLLELLVAMILGVFLLVGVFQITLANMQASRLQKNSQQIQRNGRFAIGELSYAIKTAGYSGFYGKLTDGVENLLTTPTDPRWDITKAVVGYNNVSSSQTIMGVSNILEGTDVLVVKGMSLLTVPLTSHNSPEVLVTAPKSGFSAGDILLVSDVDSASVFQAGKVDNVSGTLELYAGTGTPGNTGFLTNAYNSDAEISKYSLHMYYVKSGLNGLPSLFKASLVNTGSGYEMQENEFVSGIISMQVRYGIDGNNDEALDEYKDASTISDWSQVRSVNVALLATSKSEVVPERTSFSFNEDLFTFKKDDVASDDANKQLKRVFRTYAPLRN